jgi:hypothetical protein
MRIRTWLTASLGMVTMLLMLTTPALAECPGQPNLWPKFSEVAPSANRIVVGTVVDARGGPVSTIFDLHVDAVLRGTAPEVIEIDGLRSGAPLVGGPTCEKSAVLYARNGDVIAIAYGGRVAGVSNRVTTAAWFQGRPYVLDPGAQSLTLADIRRLARLPDTATMADESLSSLDSDPTLASGILVVVASLAAAATVWRLRGTSFKPRT